MLVIRKGNHPWVFNIAMENHRLQTWGYSQLGFSNCYVKTPGHEYHEFMKRIGQCIYDNIEFPTTSQLL
jgi:hypothetical protein